MTVTDYRIVSDIDATNLQNKVKDMISNGWQPIGGLAVYHSPNIFHQISYYQAMVIYG